MNNFVERTEMLLPEPARALGGLLGVRVPDLARGEGLPLLWHWVYLLDRPAQAELGPDGHLLHGTTSAFPARGRRRMWAGGRVRTSGPLRCGQSATKHSRVLSVQEKQGRSGSLMFIVVEHQIRQRDEVVIDEQQDIVYREAAAAAGQRPAPPEDSPAVRPADDDWVIEVSPILLFRFSALTYNAHRIHYDRDYAKQVEGYPGLLTHGPLQALAMAEAARAAGHHGDQNDGGLHFDYRLTSPLFDHQGMVVSAVRDQEAIVTAVRDIHGRQTATGILKNHRDPQEPPGSSRTTGILKNHRDPQEHRALVMPKFKQLNKQMSFRPASDAQLARGSSWTPGRRASLGCGRWATGHRRRISDRCHVLPGTVRWR